ncbi:MAG: hypothetical protein M1828_000324 [Chrysothrix sp. TS-e1954]|nr:MAG: hypothetical protein M1828_000324 [Chrysothrix sp. TS-e1954]
MLHVRQALGSSDCKLCRYQSVRSLASRVQHDLVFPGPRSLWPLRVPHVPLSHFRQSSASSAISVNNAKDVSWTPVRRIPSVPAGTKDATPRTSLDNFQELLLQSNVGDLNLKGSLWIDNSAFRDDFELWVELLEFRSRLEGKDGVLKIWRGLRMRGISLPTAGTAADQLWSALLSAGVWHSEFLLEMHMHMEDAAERGAFWKPFYNTLLRNVLRHKPRTATHWHNQLRDSAFAEFADPKSLVDGAMASPLAMGIFRDICTEFPDVKLYSHLMPVLCEARWFLQALDWHKFLVGRDDLPPQKAIIEPLRKHFMKCGFIQAVKQLDAEVSGFPSAPPWPCPPENSQLDSNASPEHAPRVIDVPFRARHTIVTDAFSARVFATKAISLDLAIMTLAAFGLRRLQPLGLRELAVRSNSAGDVLCRLDQLKEMGVMLSNDVYCRTVHKLAYEGNDATLRVVLPSDQHPDVYSDEPLQRRLLAKFVSTQDWAQVHKTLVILMMISPQDLSTTWNHMLSACIRNRQWVAVQRIFDDMDTVDIKANLAAFGDSVTELVKPGHKQCDELGFLIKVCLRIIQAQGKVSAVVWIDLCNRLGYGNRIEELGRLVLWLCKTYSKHRTNRRQAPGPLKTMFSPLQQRKIIWWGFKSLTSGTPRSKRDSVTTTDTILSDTQRTHSLNIRWLRGIALVRSLKDYGLTVSDDLVQECCSAFLAQLFDEAKTHRPFTIGATEYNMLSQIAMKRRMNEAWGKELFARSGKDHGRDSTADKQDAPTKVTTLPGE